RDRRDDRDEAPNFQREAAFLRGGVVTGRRFVPVDPQFDRSNRRDILMRRLRWALLLAVVTGALVAASQVAARPSSATAGTIKIGISLPLTGDFSEPGTAAMRGYQIWQQQINSRGGLLGKKVQLVIRDDQ